MATKASRRRVPADYKIACICPMGVELAPVEAMLDEIHDPLPTHRVQNVYTLGHIGGHNIVIAIMPEIGNNAAATVAVQLLNDFPSIRFGVLVGIGGGVARGADVRLGDVVVSQATDAFGGVVQYDLGKRTGNGAFVRTGQLNRPPSILSASVRKLHSQHRRQGHRLLELVSEMLEKNPGMQLEYTRPTTEDRLFHKMYLHSGDRSCEGCDVGQIVKRPLRPSGQPHIHYGTIGSANIVLKDAIIRDELYEDTNLLCVEMEAAGIMNDFPCLVIRGICDYADSHKNKEWQPYAAAVAAAYMKEILQIIPIDQVLQSHSAVETTPQESLQSTLVHPDRRRKYATGHGQHLVHEQVNGMQKFTSGSCLGQAPSIRHNFFIGRGSELKTMANMLLSNEDINSQHRLVLGGMGGIGKTQLALAYAQRYSRHYSSVFWLNATSEATLTTSFQSAAKRIFTPQAYHALEIQHLIDYVHSWLSHPSNTSWLLIFDNYDEPQLYDICASYPNTAHGTIIITSRRPDLVAGEQFLVKPLQELSEGLRILQTRSGRDDIESDPSACCLAERLAGLPLALVTAGAFLRKSIWTCQQYLDAYEERWSIITQTLLSTEYQGQTLRTTWELSYDRLKKETPDAAKLLRLFAYFGHQAIWYELLHAGVRDDLPNWLLAAANDLTIFEGLMHALVDYCFIETHITTQTYSIHTCVHDWTSAGLNRTIESWSYWYAFNCVASSIRREDWESLGHVRYARYTPHATNLLNVKFVEVRQDLVEADWVGAECIVLLLQNQAQLSSADLLQGEVLVLKEKALGADHISTLGTVRNLGSLYRYQDKLVEAEQMYTRALIGQEKALGSEHTSTLRTVNSFGHLYCNQGKLTEAEQMYTRALAGYEKALGLEHKHTLSAVNGLGYLYLEQGKLTEAEQMYTRALAGYEKALGLEHTLTLWTVNSLGYLYRTQGKLTEAEQMYTRALAGYEKVLGLEHKSTLWTVKSLGSLYFTQNKLTEAKQMLDRALVGYTKIHDQGSLSRLAQMLDVATLSVSQRNREKA